MRALVWPIVIVVSAAVAGVAMIVDNGSALRSVLAVWFILFCPGIAFVRLLRLKDVLTELTLAIALSIALSTIVAEVMLYLHIWSPAWGFLELIILAVIGADLQMIQALRQRQPEHGEDT